MSKLKKLLADATPRPWDVLRRTNDDWPVIAQDPGPVLAEMTEWAYVAKRDKDTTESNAALIVHLVNRAELYAELLEAAKHVVGSADTLKPLNEAMIELNNVVAALQEADNG